LLGVADVAHLVDWQLQLLQHCNHFPLSVTCWWWVVVRMDCIQSCMLGYHFISRSTYIFEEILHR